MGFRVNTNIAAMNSHSAALMNNRELDLSLARLSSGLRINTAADDASGMVIADSLRNQATGLGQAIKNANDAIGIVQTADKAMDEQIKILNTIKTKATQAAADGQNTASRAAIQGDITKLLQELDNIAQSTQFNGLNLLSGVFTNKEFQIGSESNQTIAVDIGDTSSAKIGSVRFETSGVLSSGSTAGVKFTNIDGSTTSISNVTISTGAGTGLGALAEAINRASDATGVRASAKNVVTGSSAVMAASVTSLVINGTTIGDVTVLANDSDGALRNAINAVKALTGVQASVDENGRMSLTSDGRGMRMTATGLSAAVTKSGGAYESYGRITLTSLNARDIVISGGSSTLDTVLNTNQTSFIGNLRSVTGKFSGGAGIAGGAFANATQSAALGTQDLGAGVTTKAGAMMVMDIAESAMRMLGKIRANLGSTQNQLISTINNISVTRVNVAAAESQIRDVDFAEESANFSKRNILAQSGSYAMSQANAIQQNVLRQLQ